MLFMTKKEKEKEKKEKRKEKKLISIKNNNNKPLYYSEKKKNFLSDDKEQASILNINLIQTITIICTACSTNKFEKDIQETHFSPWDPLTLI